MAARPFSFFNLARELRDMIYVHYVTIDGGYIFNSETWKLKSNSKDGSPNLHLFGLQLTCKLVASEMTGLALSHNLITFLPIDTMRERAFRFDTLISMHFFATQYLLRDLVTEMEWQMPESVKERLMPHCPAYLRRDLSDGLFNCSLATRNTAFEPIGMRRMWAVEYVAPSERLAFVQRLMQQPEFAQFFARSHPEFIGLDLLNQTWKMPSHDEIDTLFTIIEPLATADFQWIEELHVERQDPTEFFQHGHEHPNYFIYRFSAAAAAIGFLGSLKPSTRLHMRKILLNEDRESAAHPEMHGKGLVRFCDENPLLCIERRISFWKALLPISIRSCPKRMEYGRAEQWIVNFRREQDGTWYRNRWWEEDAAEDEPRGPFAVAGHNNVVDTVATWALEAASLPSSISLVIDGDPLPERSSQVFDHFIIRDAVWQAALEQCLSSGHLAPSDGRFRSIEQPQFDCVYIGFPQLVRDIINGSSNVRLNFHVENSLDQDIEHLIWERRDWKLPEWEDAWNKRNWQCVGWPHCRPISPAPPLANHWFEILEGDQLPQTKDF